MTGAGELQRQTDEELGADDQSAIRAAIEAFRREINTSCPGIVRSFDAASQTAIVTPVHKRLFVGETEEFFTLPDCLDVPVVFPRGGNFVFTFPVAAGDEVMLVFSQRALDNWWDRGDVQAPGPVRFHDLSDAMAIPGLASRPRFVQSFATDAAEIRTLDGAVVMRLEGARVVITADQVLVGGDEAGTEPAAKGQTLQQYLTALAGLLALHAHPAPGGATSASLTLSDSIDPPGGIKVPTITADKAKVL